MKPLRIPDEIDKVPQNRGGVYSFHIRFPNDYELGIFDSSLEFERIVNTIKNKITTINTLINLRTYSGESKELNKASHLERRFSIGLSTTPDYMFDEIFDNTIASISTKDGLRELTRAIRTSFLVSPPIYIGMTEKQSLRKRLDQHISGSTQFSGRLTSSGFGWSDIEYRFVVIDNFFIESAPHIEKLIQFLFKPTLSTR